MDGYGPGTYGDGFVDVYDDWYHDVSPVEATVGFLLRRTRGRVLELGSGTGRLTAPLTDGGVDVVGLDASEAMVRRGVERAEAVPAFVADMTSPPVVAGSFDLVFVAFNTLFNVPDADGQQAVFAAVAAALAPGGRFVVEAFVPVEAPSAEAGDHAPPVDDRVEVSRMNATSVTLRISRTDFARRTVSGHFVELRHGDSVRLRPWHLRFAAPAELDAMATRAGFVVEERFGDWGESPFTEHSSSHVTVYRRLSSARR